MGLGTAIRRALERTVGRLLRESDREHSGAKGRVEDLGAKIITNTAAEGSPQRLEVRVAKDPEADVDVQAICRSVGIESNDAVHRDANSVVFTATVSAGQIQSALDAMESGVLDATAAAAGGRFVQSICVEGICLASYVPAVPEKQGPQLVPIASVKLLQELEDIDLVVLTTTDIERRTLHRFMTPLPGESGLLEGAKKLVTYRVGLLGRYKVAHVECTQGAIARQGSTLTIGSAITEARPKAILILGIAFGVNPRKQRLGDVLVASSIVPYELERKGVVITERRGEQLICGPTLLERFRTRTADWRLLCGLENVNVQQGLVLSGEKLIDNKVFRDQLVAKFEGALGGEMEGAGAYAAAEREGVEVILVKSICDWADGHKSDRAQPFAAYSAVHLAHHVLSRRDSLGSLDCVDRGPGGSDGRSVETATTGPVLNELAAQRARWDEVLELLRKDKRILRDEARRKWATLNAEGSSPPSAVVVQAEALICSDDVTDDESYRLAVLLREHPPADYGAVVHRLVLRLTSGTFHGRDDTALAVAYEGAKYADAVDWMLEWLAFAKRTGGVLGILLSAIKLFLATKPDGYEERLEGILAVGHKYSEHSEGRRIVEAIGDRKGRINKGLESPTGSGNGELAEVRKAARAIVLDFAIEWAAKLDLDNWRGWTSFLLSNDHPRMDADHDARLEDLRNWLLARAWPEGFDAVRAGFTNFRLVLQDFHEAFRSRASVEGSMLITKKFYQIDEWDPERYKSLSNQYKDHVDLVQDLVLELNRAANFVCDRVREAIDPRFRMIEGRAVVESGPTMEMRFVQLAAEYRGAERVDRPYPGIEAFREVRYSRADGFCFGRRDGERETESATANR